MSDKSKWTLRQWLDSGYKWDSPGVCIYKRSDDVYVKGYPNSICLYPVDELQLSHVVRDTEFFILADTTLRLEAPNFLACSCDIRVLMMSGCQCGGS